METYLVGGAVRDELLGIEAHERDWVVVGATEQEMLDAGYRKVGSDFPVFLHPKSGEEFALARTERKTSRGHTGFECNTEDVPLEDDLKRRDLTINAIARDGAGNLVDPWGGVADLEGRLLRHVSPAFAEDPLRILRVARFAARFYKLGFSVDTGTIALMQDMTRENVLSELPAERIYTELDKALATEDPEAFFDLLDKVGANERLWPEITPVCVEHLSRAKEALSESSLRCAALLSPLDQETIETLSRKLKIPNRPREIALATHSHATAWPSVDTLPAGTIVDVLYELDSFRQTERFASINKVLSAVTANETVKAEVLEAHWMNLQLEASRVTADAVGPGLAGPQVGAALRQARIEHIEKLRQ